MNKICTLVSYKISVADVLAPAPALTPEVTSAAGNAKKIFCTMPNGGDKT